MFTEIKEFQLPRTIYMQEWTVTVQLEANTNTKQEDIYLKYARKLSSGDKINNFFFMFVFINLEMPILKMPLNNSLLLLTADTDLPTCCDSNMQGEITVNFIKGKAIPLQAWTGPQGSRRLRLPDFKTIGT